MPATPTILQLNAFDPGATGGLDDDTARLLARRQAVMGRNATLFYREPIVALRGEGVWIHAADGRRYLDVYNNVPSVGHCHPHVVAAMARQAAVLNTHTRYLSEPIYAYAERLLATMPAAVSNIVFVCTGSEANDLALRVARTATGRTGVIVTENAYHGNTAAVTEISPSSGGIGSRAPHVRTVPAPRDHGADTAARFAADVVAAIQALEADGHGIAALVADTIFSSDGVFADPAGFLAPAVDAVRAAGGLFVADEVQPGFGRTGTMWGFARHGIVPDMVSMGKPMGNGYPMAGLALRPDLLSHFTEDCGYFNTFGGSPVAAAVGSAVLDVIEGEGLLANAAQVGAYLKARIAAIAQRHEAVAAVRGAGLFVGLEFRGSERVAAITSAAIEGLRDHGILIGAAGQGDTLKIRPPLCFTREHADLFADALASVLRRVLD